MNFVLDDVVMKKLDLDLLLLHHFLHPDQVVLVLMNEILLVLMAQKLEHLSK
jgi:hypothetical protein